jgi:hypothetical protein
VREKEKEEEERQEDTRANFTSGGEKVTQKNPIFLLTRTIPSVTFQYIKCMAEDGYGDFMDLLFSIYSLSTNL